MALYCPPPSWPTRAGSMPTDREFTGQRAEGMGLMDYGARFYWPRLGRFVSPDSIVPQPGDPQSLNRYSYVLNNPMKFTDPTGHAICRTQQDCQDAASSPSGRRTLRQFTSLTRWLVKEMNNVVKYKEVVVGKVTNYVVPLSNSPRIENPVAMAMFYDMVAGGRPFDFKDAIDRRLGQDVTFGGYRFANKHQAAGNIFYGFLGTAMGFSPQTLHSGAAFAEWKDAFIDKQNGFAGVTSDIRTMGDGIDDYHQIELGISLYRLTIGSGREVTEQVFMALMSNFTEEVGKQTVPSGSVVFETDAGIGSFDGATKPKLVPWWLPNVVAR